MPDTKRVRVACLMMQRDEDDLLRPWIMHHAALFGSENIHVFDNGSASASVVADLVEFARKGVNVHWKHTAPGDYHRKGDLLGGTIRSLAGRYDFFLPLDCDEFFALKTGPQSVACDKQAVHAALASLAGEQRALVVKEAHFNVPRAEDLFWCWPFQKTFFAGDTLEYLDHGHHNGRSKQGGSLETGFVYVHYHHKPYDTMLQHAKNKLRPYVDVEDRAALERYAGTASHCKKIILDGREAYERWSETRAQSIRLPEIPRHLRSIDAPVPFA